MNLANLSQAEIEAGKFGIGSRRAYDALNLGWQHDDPGMWELCLVVLGELAIATGRHDDGLRIIRTVLAARGTPSLQREVDEILAFHDVAREAASHATKADVDTDLADLVEELLAAVPSRA